MGRCVGVSVECLRRRAGALRRGATWPGWPRVRIAASATLVGFVMLVGARPGMTSPLRSNSSGWMDRGAARTNPADTPPWLPGAAHRARLTAPDGSAFDEFGVAVDVDGDTAVVGAELDDTTAGVDAGSAYVFVRSGGRWTLQARLTAPDGAASDFFGGSVAVDGDTTVVAAVFDDTPAGSQAGSAWVFVRSGTAWNVQAHLTAPDAEANDSFGSAVSLDGDTAVVGADTRSSNTGSAYVFVRTGTAWTSQAELTAPDAESGELFGASVAVSADTAVVGASHDNTPAGFESGSAWVFVRSGTAWSSQAQLTAQDAGVGDDFGRSVAVNADTALVGAFADDTPAGPDAGSAYVFVRSGTAWSQQAHLTAPDGAVGDLLGVSAGLDGDVAVVGAEADDTPGGPDAGSAYVFVRSGGLWTPQAHLVAPDGHLQDFFGYSVALDGLTAIAGAEGHDTPSGTGAGAAYAFWR